MNYKKTDTTKELSDKVFDLIEERQVTPTPKWQFLLKNNTFWGAWVLSVIIGAVSIAATLFALSNAGWELYTATHNSFLELVIGALPYLWLVVLLFMITVAYYNVRHTQRGYRYPIWAIVLASIAVSFVGGGVLHGYGLGETIDERAGKHIPLYRPALVEQQALWNNPTRGLLAGEVVSVDDAGNFVLQTFEDEEWEVEGEDLRARDLEAVREGTVRVVGLPTRGEEKKMHACFVIPWEVYGGREVRPMPTKRIVQEFRERKFGEERSNECKGVRPYQTLQRIQNQINR